MPVLRQDSVADIMQALLVQLGLGSDPPVNAAWPVYVGSEPTEPDNCITVYDSVGVSAGQTGVDNDTLDHFGFQARVRGANYSIAFEKAASVRGMLAEHVNLTTVTVSGTTRSYLVWCVAKVSQPMFIGTDVPKSKRVLFTLNATVSIRNLNP